MADEWLIIEEWPEVDERAKRREYVLKMNDALAKAALKADLENKPMKAFGLRSLIVPKMFI